MRSRGFRVTLLSFTLLSGIEAQPTIDLEGRYWIPQMSSRLRVEAGGFGTDIDARRDLGMQDANFAEGGATLRAGGHQLGFLYTPIDFNADQNVSRTVVFRGQPYTVGTRVVSELEIQHLQLYWAYQFIRVADNRFRLGPMIEADGFIMHGSLAAPNLSQPITQKEDISVGLPTVGLALDIEPHRLLHVYGRVAGMKVGDYGYFIGSEAGVKVRPIKLLFFSVGYRTFNLHVENSPDFARLQLRGPFVGAGIHF
jgi:hypothetical protein